MSLNIGVLCDIHWDNFILIHTKFKKINSEYFRLHTLYGKTLDIINCCASQNLLTLIKHSSDNLSKTLYNLLKLCDIWLLFTNQIEFLTPVSLVIQKCNEFDIKYIIVSEHSRTKDYYSFEKVHEKFKDNLNDISRCLNKLTVNLAINYGSKNEMIDTFRKIKLRKINQKNFENNLNLKPPFPDILIRTGGYNRLSNFLLWQLAYTEIFFLKKLWPDFNDKDLINIIKKFQTIKRNFGGI